MTTPRVTVPVEILRELIDSSSEVRDLLAKTPEMQGREYNGTGIRFVNAIGAAQRAYVSVATAPEGGAVSPQVYRLLQLADAALANVTAFESDARYIMGNTNYAIADNARSEIRQFLLALATREEAPAEAGEDAAWTWLNGHVDGAPADRDYSADEMVDAFMAGAGQRARLVKALESIADEHQYRSGYCQTDIAVEPALTAAEAQTVARAALRAHAKAREEAQPVAGRLVKTLNAASEKVAQNPERSMAIRENWTDGMTAAVGTVTPEALENLKAGGSSAILPPHNAGVALYTTPPAPEAEKLRVAVEALAEARSELEAYERQLTGETYNNLKLNSALAALQAEQKGGA